MKVKVEVTEQDIDDGSPNNCSRCPVALAVKRSLGSRRDVHISYGFIKVGDQEVKTPETVRHFMLGFDTFNEVLPFEFEFYLPE